MISDGKDKYKWPLNETEGNIAHSDPWGNDGVASNPIWMGLLKRHNTWENILSKSFPGNVRTAFDTQNNDLYIFSRDSIYILNESNHAFQSIPNSNPSSVMNPNFNIPGLFFG